MVFAIAPPRAHGLRETVQLGVGEMASSSVAAIHLDRWSAFAVEPVSAKSAQSIVETRVRPLQDLLVVTLGRSVRLIALLLQPKDSDPRDGLGEAYFEAVQPAAEQTASLSSVLSFSAPTLLTARDAFLPLGDLIAGWFALRSQLHDAIVLLLGRYYASFMYGEQRFASVFQSAEALHRNWFSGQELRKSQHRARVKAIVEAAGAAAVDAEVVAWARRVLRSRNDKPLWQRIEELVRSTGMVGEAVVTAAPNFSKTVSGTRTGVSHGGAPKRLDSTERYWYEDVLLWIIRMLLLRELGLDRDELERRVLSKAPFQHAIDQIRDTEPKLTSADEEESGA